MSQDRNTIPTKSKGDTDCGGTNTPARKLTRAERKPLNKAAQLQAEAQAIAAYAAAPPTLTMLQAMTAENPAALVPAQAGDVLRAREGDSSREGDKQEETRKPGRPSEYTDEQADHLCGWIACGGSLRGWCKETGRTPDTVYRWMRQDAQFHARYARAHEDRADTLTDEILEIADEASKLPSIEGVAAAKLQVEARKWIASKLRPQKWGDKQLIEHQGNVSIRIGIPQKPAATVVDVTPSAPKLT